MFERIKNNYVRRLLCLPILEDRGPAVQLLRQSGNGAPAPAAAEPEVHTLRQAFYPIALFFTVCYAILQVLEFLSARHPRPPQSAQELYFGLLGIFAGEQELRRWTGKADGYILAAEFILGLWWLLYIVLMMAIGFNPDLHWALPADLRATCLAVSAIFFGAGVSKYIHGNQKGSGRGEARDKDDEEKVLAHVKAHGRITSRECSDLLGGTARHAARLLAGLVQAGILEHEGDRRTPGVGYRLKN